MKYIHWVVFNTFLNNINMSERSRWFRGTFGTKPPLTAEEQLLGMVPAGQQERTGGISVSRSLYPIRSMGLEYLPTFTIDLGEM